MHNARVANKYLIPLFFMMLVFSACTQKQDDNPETWSDEEIDAWFEQKAWLNSWDVTPDESINRRSLAVQYFRNKKHWDQTFAFLKTHDLKNMPLGKQELDGDSLFVNVEEYITKDKSETRYESHKKYIDIQYIIEGEEVIGLTTPDNLEVTEPYTEEKDIAFYSFDGGEYVKATPENFVIFFPEDAHRPLIKAEENSKAKKIVVKVMLK